VENFLWLATEAAEDGFGLNLDILETNLVNLVIIIAVLVYFGRKFLGNILSERRERIETAIREAEQRASQAAEALSDGQQKLAQAQAEAERIRADADKRAQAAKEEILAQCERDLERMKSDARQELDTERDRAIAELRQRVTELALQRVESQLQERLDESAQRQLIDRSIATLGGN
jgi:F-type H+-transporting ATPase subunit b